MEPLYLFIKVGDQDCSSDKRHISLKDGDPVFYIDPNDVNTSNKTITFIKEKAGTGVKKLINLLK